MHQTTPTTITRLFQLGSGGMGDVYLALARRHEEFQRLVVVKTLRDDPSKGVANPANLREEARISSRLNHPNVVQITEIVELDSGIMLVMEYLEGMTFADALRQGGDAFSLPLRLRAICEALAGLHYAHELRDLDGRPLNVIHRDVSPENLFLTYDGRVKLLDFGVAKANGGKSSTETGVVKGRVSYMSCEHVQGQDLDRRADIFAMGCVLFEAIANRRLWKGMSQGEIAASLASGVLPRLGQEPPVDAPLRAIVERAMAISKGDRFATAEEMRLSLEAYLEAQPIQVLPRDIGYMLSSQFGAQRDKRKADIAEAVHQVRRSGSQAPTPLVPASGSETKAMIRIPRTESPPRDLFAPDDRSSSGSSFAEPSPYSQSQVRPIPSPQLPEARRGHKRFVVLGILAVTASAVLFFFWQASSGGGDRSEVTTSEAREPQQPAPTPARDAAPDHPTADKPAGTPSETEPEGGDRALDGANEEDVVGQSAPSSEVNEETGSNTKSVAGQRRVWRAPRPRVSAVPTAPSPARAPSPAGQATACSPPYYYKDGIKTYKPECL